MIDAYGRNIEDLEEEILMQGEGAMPPAASRAPAGSLDLDVTLPDISDDSEIQAARADRDRQVGTANLMQGLTQIGTALGSSGQMKADSSVFDAARRGADTNLKDLLADRTTKRRVISDAIKQKALSDRQAKQFAQQNEQLDKRLAVMKQIADARVANTPKRTSVGQQAADREFGKIYTDFTTKGGVNALTTMENLSELAEQLKKSDPTPIIGEGGRFGAILPDFLKTREAVSARDQARNFANTTLKELFGGQLSDAEREAAAKEYYNEALDNEANAEIIKRKLVGLKRAYEAKRAQADYFEKNDGSLAGYPGSQANEELLRSIKGIGSPAISGGGRKVAKKQINRKLGKTRIVYSDGTEEVVDGIQ